MSFWSNFFSGFSAAFTSALLDEVVVQAKVEVDKLGGATPDEKVAMKAGIDLLTARVKAKLPK